MVECSFVDYRLQEHGVAVLTLDNPPLHLNTPVSSVMELLNEATEFTREEREGDAPFLKEAGRAMALLLQPFAPHVSEEIWEALGGTGSILRESWPVADPGWLREDLVEVVVPVNGRLRGHVRAQAGAGEAEVAALARDDERIASHLSGKEIRKTIYLPGRLLNIVVR